ncbi:MULTISPECIES: S-layer homology domain-containing protein [Bacillus cereus group]|uniref:S-layer domain protein n=1 Tax=Bacillus cytotoxicus (strain DSM 22905 / CIP 110041 / 391-98 / NVH 391-98) TaxID=315749 RepID=A7GL31_BACCN|nr:MULTISPECIES: S-layer homology domain-containing protein [Bacillus cereus group]ABS20839.1 S-layer domain protein [Bacillus cytotoxicus NVH 391-98]AWC43574.1 S-layer protein [Bacillus cytotoxicus]MDH2864836.1 S-layer homology domain-containing protein [Bacillus cytotoxicus]MDH2884799.1 S-layer homology domain-containing protein [Bacillus cytotoxicus]MDH2888956.1 S-layer homology domain-containing protein [Bacillus cytotoxicus]
MYTKLLKSITSLTLIGSALLYTHTDTIKAAEVPSSFSDVPQKHWAYPAITTLASQNIIAGYGNGKFGLGDVATREQVAALIYRVLFPNKKNGTFSNDNTRYILKDGSQLKNPYRDITHSSTMFPEEILALTDLGIFKGDDQGTFRPKDSISRAEMAQIIKNAFHLSTKQGHIFHDIPKNFWAEDAISAIQSNHIAAGTGDGNFEPFKTVTREQYAQFLYNALEYNKQANGNMKQQANTPPKDMQLLEEFKHELQKHINAYEVNITLPYKTQNSNRQEVMDILFNAYKELMNTNEYANYTLARTSYSLSGSPGNYRFTLNITYRESKEQREYVMKQTKAIVQSIIQSGMDDHERVKAIHDYVVKHIAYDTSYHAYTAYEALANRSAVCQGYALLTYQLLKEAGIDNHIVTGTGNGEPHAWNLVKIDNKWYHLDTTFDDPIPDEQGRVMYSYFNVTDEQLSKDHQWNRNAYPTATTNYYNELINKVSAGSPKSASYEQILKDTKLMYQSKQYVADNYEELTAKLQQQFSAKPEKVEVLYKQSVQNAMQDIKKALAEIHLPAGAQRASYKATPYSAKEGYSFITITFTY